jgi:cysteinyl-tRNA synthetase
MQIFNTMSRQKEEFVPQTPGEYRIYVCGPTVYNYIHIGNARPMIVFDTLRRYLEYCGNKVYYVSNITDIDDKLIKKGQEEGTSMQEVARKFEAEYIKDSDGLNVKAPTVRPSISVRSSTSSRTWSTPAMLTWPATAMCTSA